MPTINCQLYYITLINNDNTCPPWEQTSGALEEYSTGLFISGKYMDILNSGKKYFNIDPVLKSCKLYQNIAVLKYGIYTLKWRPTYYFLEAILK